MLIQHASAVDTERNHVIPWNVRLLLASQFFAPLHVPISSLPEGKFPMLEDLNAALGRRPSPITVQNGAPLVFVLQARGKLPFELQYEPRCYLRGEVPTRAGNWHDLFNALVWLTFPEMKAAMNARHYRAMTGTVAFEHQTSASERGGVRDVTTLLDESGVIVVSSNIELIRMMKNFEWKELFWHRRREVLAHMRFYIVGHGLYEKALRPYVGMTGHGMLLQVASEFHDLSLEQQLVNVDMLVAEQLRDEEKYRIPDELSPVPLLGIPGWMAENDNAAFYDNTTYFRRGRLSHNRSAKN
jgi:hypothetical protein